MGGYTGAGLAIGTPMNLLGRNQTLWNWGMVAQPPDTRGRNLVNHAALSCLALGLLATIWGCSSEGDDASVPSDVGGTNAGGAASTSATGTSSSTNTSSSVTGGNPASATSTGAGGTGPIDLPAPACDAEGGSAEVAEPELIATLFDRWHEAWLGSPAVADLDGDGEQEIIVPRDSLVLGWHLDGEQVFRAETEGGRIWASPIVADLVADSPGLEVAVASRGQVYVWTSDGDLIPGFPTEWQDELRTIAAGDIDGDEEWELVAATTDKLSEGDKLDILIAFEMDGSVAEGFPPNTTDHSGCDDACYTQGVFDQNLALGDLDGDGSDDILAPQDNAYISLHHGSGVAFDSHPMFENPTKVDGVRFLHDLGEAQQGWAEDEETALQAHFTNTAPALVDLDGDAELDLVMLGSVQNAAQTDRFKGVALWAIHSDGTRLDGWTEPLHFPDYLAGLWDFEGTNVVGATNQVAVADIDPGHAGVELVFAGFDGRIHAVSSTREELWSYTYTEDDRVLTGGVVIADLSKDGVPELVFNSYSPDTDKGHLFVLNAGGDELYKLGLPGRGAMPVPTVADVDGDGSVEIVVSLKDGEDGVRQVLVYTVPGSGVACLPWPTGRGNLMRDGHVRG